MKALHLLLFPAFRLLSLLIVSSNAFQPHAFVVRRLQTNQRHTSATRLHSSSAPTLTPKQQDRRSTLLSRNGPYFKLDRMRGKVEFGSTAHLVTQLSSTPNKQQIAGWLADERRVALSIWDPSLVKEKGNAVYELQVMQLQFVTITLAPTVDVKMWTSDDTSGLPVFSLQSTSFDPNLQILPGIGVNADSLGIVIEVVGNLSPTADGKGVAGKIAFQSGGELPPPMRLLPEPALKAASDAICDTVSKFAIQSFQQGAIAKYKEYAASTQQQE